MRKPSESLPLRPTKAARRPAAAIIWLILAGTCVVAVLAAVLGVLVWHKTDQVQALEAQVRTLQDQRVATEGRLNALLATATVMENRVATLEANDPAQQIAALQQAVEKATDAQQTADLRTSLTDMQTRIGAFQSALDQLGARIDAVSGGSGAALPSEASIDVAPQRQAHNLSCESAAASMVARFLGVNLSEADVLAALPRNPNPNLGFRGNVDGPTGGITDYGVYAGPIMSVLNSHGLRAVLLQGEVEGIRAAIVRRHPVIAWVTYDMRVVNPVVETIGGQQVTLVPNEHAVVVTGYDAQGFWVNDPWVGRQRYYATADLERGMSYFGDMALEVSAP